MLFAIKSPALRQISDTLQLGIFYIEILRITYKMNEFSVDMHFKLFTISKMKNKYNHSTALKCGSFSEKTSKKSNCALMIRIIITFANQVFL